MRKISKILLDLANKNNNIKKDDVKRLGMVIARMKEVGDGTDMACSVDVRS